jgi:hypothetical protein
VDFWHYKIYVPKMWWTSSQGHMRIIVRFQNAFKLKILPLGLGNVKSTFYSHAFFDHHELLLTNHGLFLLSHFHYSISFNSIHCKTMRHRSQRTVTDFFKGAIPRFFSLLIPRSIQSIWFAGFLRTMS